MYKWLWLGVGVVFAGAALWMLNDMRVQLRQSSAAIQAATPAIQSLHQTSTTINEKLPAIVDRTQKTSEVVADNLPKALERIQETTETVAELSADVRQLKQLAGLGTKARDEGLVAYGNSLLDKIAASGGEIGTRKTFGKGLKNKRPATEWVVGARREAVIHVLLVAKSKKDLLERLGKTALGGHWYIELPNKEPVTLIDWAKTNHAESKGL